MHSLRKARPRTSGVRAALVALAGLAAGAAPWAPQPRGRLGSADAATRPARSPAAAASPDGKYPPQALVAACARRAEEVRRALAPDGRAVVRPPFVVAGDMDEDRLTAYAQGSVVRPAQAMWAAYFDRKPTEVITVLLFAGARNYRQYAKRDYPEGGEPYFGYYVHTDRRMVMNIQTGTGTLVHELTHALIAYDFPGVPTWFNEGLASLHEQCSVKEDTIVGLTNWRLAGLQKAVEKGELRPLRDLLTKRDFYGRLQGVNYAQARYFVMYMQDRELLQGFYRHFRKHHEGDGADVKAIEHIFGRGVEEVEKGFLAWVKPLKFEG